MSDLCIKWETWGERALNRAKEESKPLYLFFRSDRSPLSLEMERSSFSDDEVVKFLNDDFVSVKIDREEQPVLEETALMACQVMNGMGGFPLNLFLTPELKPFFVGRYMPLKGDPSAPGVADCLPRIKWLWLTESQSVTRASDEIMEGVVKSSEVRGEVSLEKALEQAAARMGQDFDDDFGGFGKGPKVPLVPRLLFLEEYSRVFGCQVADSIFSKTLDVMSQRSIRDHLGGGFFSLCKNRDWSDPVAEKRLSDQAMMAIVFAEGFDRYGKVAYWRAADEALAFISMNLYGPDRGFFIGTVPSSHGDGYYRWSEEEVDGLLGPDGPLFRRSLGISGEGSIPSMASSAEDMAQKEGFDDPDDLIDLLAKGHQILSSARSGRVAPTVDSRVMTDGSALAIVALARCGRLMDRPNYIKFGEREFSRLLDGEIVHCQGVPAFLDDYSFMIWAGIELYRSTDDKKWLDASLELEGRARDLFSWGCGYRVSSVDGEGILFRRSSGQDGSVPSGAGVMAGNLVSLWLINGNDDYLIRSRQLVEHFGGAISRHPEDHPCLLTSILRNMA